jgi:hypothetical protein
METLRGGIVGFGYIAENGHAPAYRACASRFEIQAIAETCALRRPLAQRAFPAAKIYATCDEMLLAQRLDFVDVCAPPSEHARVASAALAKGLHVLCEKPLALGTDQARAMTALASREKRVLYPAHSYRHAPVVRAVQSVIERGRIGAVNLVTMSTFRTGHAKGVREWHPDWRRDAQFAGGGVLMDHGPHTLYLAFDWLRSYPTRVSAWAESKSGVGVDDEVSLAASFPTGRLRAHLTWNAGMRRVIYTLHGERGAMRVDDDELELVIRDRDGLARVERSKLPSEWSNAGHGPWFEGVLSDFSRAIRVGDWVSRETEDSVRAMESIAGAYDSSRQGGQARSLASAPQRSPA